MQWSVVRNGHDNVNNSDIVLIMPSIQNVIYL